MSDYSIAVAYTFLASLPHVFALATLVHHVLGHIRFVRTKFFTMCNLISAHQQLGGGITESLPHRLEHSCTYQTFKVVISLPRISVSFQYVFFCETMFG